MNKHLLTGNLTRDPEFKVTTSGKSRCAFTVASQRPFKNSEGRYDADFISCVAWGKTAEFINSYFKKGQSIEAEGWVKVEKFVDTDGNTRWSTVTVVTHAMFNGRKSDSDGKPIKTGDSLSVPDYSDIPSMELDEDDLPF